MPSLEHLFENNRRWARDTTADHPEFFHNLARQQNPDFLWIGCSDSRVPANQIVGLAPGEVFVHRNVGNVVPHNDLNCLTVLEYGIAVLHVEHVIVCGHYGCGGVSAAMQDRRLGVADHWLRMVRDVRDEHAAELDALPAAERLDRLCELNVMAQVAHVCRTNIAQAAWDAGRPLAVHGWIYRLEDGLVSDLGVTVNGVEGVPAAFRVRAWPPA